MDCPAACEDSAHAFPYEDQLYSHLRVVHHLDPDIQSLPGCPTSLCSTLPRLGQPLNLTLQLANVPPTSLTFTSVYPHRNLLSMGDAAEAKPVDFADLDLTHDSQSFIPSSSIPTLPTASYPPDNSLPSPPAPSPSQLGFLCAPEKKKNVYDTWLIPQLQIAGTSAIMLDPVRPGIATIGAAQERSVASNLIAICGEVEPDVDFEEEWAIQQWERWQGDADANSPLHDGATIDAVMPRLEEAGSDQPYDSRMDIDVISELMETSL
jgi:hypothetical protein